MNSSPDSRHSAQIRTYVRSECVVFRKTNEEFGGLSNMAAGFPLEVNGIRIFTSEALYQACRFPHLPDVQRLIIGQTSPMTAKMKSKPYQSMSRPDWSQVRVKVMRWCLQVKLAQNWSRFSELLLRTGDRPIVEESRKDTFWGAKAVDERTLVGTNALGRLLMELRENLKSPDWESLTCIEPVPINDFLLNGRPIGVVTAHGASPASAMPPPTQMKDLVSQRMAQVKRLNIFNQDVSAAAGRERRRSLIADIKPYAEYKDSGLPWLGRIPAQWELLRSKYLFREVDQRSITGDETRLSMSQKFGLIPSSQIEEHRLVSENYVGAKICEAGYLVLNRLKAHLGVFALASERGLVSPDYTVFRPTRPMEAKYFEAYYRTPECRIELRRRARGIVEGFWRLYTDDFYDICAPVPSQDEQAAIVRFLDYANQRLERTIRAKRKVIALLNEQKQAIIHYAVTRGLDPNVPLKSSGIPWLGEIPAHWVVKPLKRWVGINRETLPETTDSDCELKYLDIGAVATGHLVEQPEIIRFGDAPSRARRILRKGDTIISTVRTYLKAVYFVANAAPNLIASTGFAVMTPSEETEPEFLSFVIQSHNFIEQVTADSIGIAYPAIAQTRLAAFHVAFPPTRSEQKAIVAQVRASTAKLEPSVLRAQQEIELVREYRTRLIADVVTGKLDVREAARQLPIEADEPVTFIEADQLDEGEESFDGDVEMIAGDAEDSRE